MSRIWDLRARLYGLFEASNFRRGPSKRALFRRMQGRVLFLAIGTGVDIAFFPPGKNVVAIDINEQMLLRATLRRANYAGVLEFVRADALNLAFPDAAFDTVVTSCTMCSVPDPIRALRELHRVLRPGGRILMFEHVRSQSRMLGLTLDLMTLWTRLTSTEMNRDTVGNVLKAGFQITRVESVYLDIILGIHGRRADCGVAKGEL